MQMLMSHSHPQGSGYCGRASQKGNPTETPSVSSPFSEWGKDKVTNQSFVAFDVYNFGILLLELLTGKSPVHTTGNDEVVHLVRWVYSVVREEWTAEVFDIEPLKYPNIEGRDGAADRDEMCS
nr:probable inactive receptor kinase At4g23740 [Ipomoea batatas]GME20202.1 probable inactive receptor kinase At4g23740 [Ipomoea batatas]